MPNDMPARAVLAVAAARATVIALTRSIFFILIHSTRYSRACSLGTNSRNSLLINHLLRPTPSVNKIVCGPSTGAFAVAFGAENFQSGSMKAFVAISLLLSLIYIPAARSHVVVDDMA